MNSFRLRQIAEEEYEEHCIQIHIKQKGARVPECVDKGQERETHKEAESPIHGGGYARAYAIHRGGIYLRTETPRYRSHTRTEHQQVETHGRENQPPCSSGPTVRTGVLVEAVASVANSTAVAGAEASVISIPKCTRSCTV